MNTRGEIETADGKVRPATGIGLWLAKTIHEIVPMPAPGPPADARPRAEPDIDSIPGIVAPRCPQPFDVVLDKFADALTAADAASLAEFLEECRET